MRIARFAMLAALGAAFLAPGAASAQPYPPPDPAQVSEARFCLCLERAVTARQFDMNMRGGVYASSKAEFEALAVKVERDRALVNVDSSPSVSAFKELLARSLATRENFERAVLPDYQQSVARYNEAVAQLNAACQGKMLPVTAWDEARKNLACGN
jgi:hypothetical protein